VLKVLGFYHSGGNTVFLSAAIEIVPAQANYTRQK
jgi:hypothetical protein